MKATIKQKLPNMSPESRAMGEQTATILRQDGFMMTIAEVAKNPRLLRVEGTENVISMSASSESVYKIPVFAKLLKRESRAQRCVGCRRSIREVDTQDPRKWLKTMARCVGQSPGSTTAWGLHLLSFPLEWLREPPVHMRQLSTDIHWLVRCAHPTGHHGDLMPIMGLSIRAEAWRDPGVPGTELSGHVRLGIHKRRACCYAGIRLVFRVWVCPGPSVQGGIGVRVVPVLWWEPSLRPDARVARGA